MTNYLANHISSYILLNYKSNLMSCHQLLNVKMSQAEHPPVALACNPVYSGGRDQEDYSSRSAQANKVMRQPHLNKWLDMVVYNLSF
jgi:hypothetical protein